MIIALSIDFYKALPYNKYIEKGVIVFNCTKGR